VPRVTLETTGRTLDAPEGADLREVLLRRGARLYYGVDGWFECGGKGRCGRCAVLVVEGAEALSPPTPFERRLLPDPRPGLRLACQAAVRGDCRVDPSVKR